MEKEFEKLTLEQQAETLEKLTNIHASAKHARAEMLMAELAKLGIKAPVKTTRKAPVTSGDARAAVKPMYQSKKDPSLVWSGRGGTAKWLVNEMAASGLDKEAFRIQD